MPEDDQTTPPAGDMTSASSSDRRTSRVVGEWVVVIVLALVAAFVIRTFVFQTFFIPSGSMEPTLQVGDRIIVSKLSYDIHSPSRGDIVVFKAPPREALVCADPTIRTWSSASSGCRGRPSPRAATRC